MREPLKTPISFEQQLSLLEKRGMTFVDRPHACDLLSNINYYRFSGYYFHLQTHTGNFREPISFESILAIYRFDESLRTFLSKYLGIIEIRFRTQISYTLAMNHGPYALYNSANFVNSAYHASFLEKLDTAVKNNANALFVQHHQSKYGGFFPPWAAVEILSFSDLSKLYSNMLYADKHIVAAHINCDIAFLSNWLHYLSILRNYCAHYARLYNVRFSHKIKLPDSVYSSTPFATDRLFAGLYVLSHTLPSQSCREQFMADLECFLSEYPNFDLSKLGFPPNWKKIFHLWLL